MRIKDFFNQYLDVSQENEQLPPDYVDWLNKDQPYWMVIEDDKEYQKAMDKFMDEINNCF